MIRLSNFLFAILLPFVGIPQTINPDFGKIFKQNELAVIKLVMDESDKQQLIYPENPKFDIFYNASLTFQNSLIDTLVPKVGIRIRGNTSRNQQKKSFKIDFKEFGGDQFFKLKDFNLKPNNNDPSLLRECLTQLMYRNLNVPVARSSYAEVYINNEYMGIYLNVENIDDEFVDRRFANETGNLYKCSWGATLVLSNDLYKNDLYELKTNEQVNDRSKLAAFVKLLNQKDDGNWANALELIFDVDNYLRQLAVETLVGHWDGYSYNINNYYLYENPESGKIIFIPYDMDNTFGIDWVGQDWATRNVFKWSSDRFKTPLTTRILAIPTFKEKYIHYLNEGLTYFDDENYFKNIVSPLIELLSESVELDPYYPLAFGFDHQTFLDGFNVAAGNHVKYGISEYISLRSEKAHQQLPALTNVNLRINNALSIYPNPSNGEFIKVAELSELFNPIQVLDNLGRSIPLKIDKNEVVIFNNQLTPGIYMVKAGATTQKFIVAYN